MFVWGNNQSLRPTGFKVQAYHLEGYHQWLVPFTVLGSAAGGRSPFICHNLSIHHFFAPIPRATAYTVGVGCCGRFQNTPVCFEFGGAGVLCGFAMCGGGLIDMEENQDTIKRSACGIGKSGAE